MNTQKLIIATVLVSFLACTSKTNKNESSDKKISEVTQILDNKSDNDTKSAVINSYQQSALYIAALPQKDSNEYTILEKTPIWKEYKSQMDSTWARLEKKRFSVMRTFYENNFSSYRGEEKAIYYPFSGPDFLNIYLAYPKGTSYVMAGLEPVGNIPNPLNIKSTKEMQSTLAGFTKGLRTLREWGYFVTSWMGGDLNRNKLNGVLPVIYFCMARLGCTIEKTEYVSLLPSGEIQIVQSLPDPKVAMRGAKISFLHPDGKPSVVYYFSGDVSNNGLKTNGYASFVKKQCSNANSYMKAASYLCYDPNFTNMFALITETSKTILTDESGIPFEKMTMNQWNYTLFGKYYPPTSDFRWIHQPKLKSAYQDTSKTIKEIPFFTGYHRKFGQSNLQFYVKK